MRLRSRRARRRYANLERIRALDLAVDYDEIVWITSRLEFPWDYVQGTSIAFLRDYGIPSISRLLDRIHGHYDIPNDEFQYVLATTIVGPIRWISRYGWRELDAANRRLTDATLRIGRATASPAFLRPFARRVTIALMDEPLREALGQPAQPRWLTRGVESGLRGRALALRFASPRAQPYEHRPTTYPLGFRLGDLGPASMLDDLNRDRGHTKESA